MINDWYVFLANRQGNVPLDITYWLFILVNFVMYLRLSFGPTNFKSALRRIKAGAYGVLAFWITYKVYMDRGDLPITVPALFGWIGVMFTDLCHAISIKKGDNGNK